MYNPNPYNFPASPFGYAGGGNVAPQQSGLPALAEQLRRRGREGDTILAHINPQEAGILKLLGGSGTINPYTGLPEYKFRLKSVFRPIEKAVSSVVNEVKSVGRQIDDVVNNSIPGGWATVAAVTAAAVGAPGLTSTASFAPEAAAATGAFDAGIGLEAMSGGAGALGAGTAAGAGAATGAYDAGIGLDAMSGAPAAAAPAPVLTPPPATVGTGAYDAGIGLDAMGGAPTVPPPPPTDYSTGQWGAGGPGEAAGAGAGAGATAAGATAAGAGTAAEKSILDTIKGFIPSNLKEVKDAAQLASMGAFGYGTLSAAQETKKQREAAEQELARQAAKRAEDIRTSQSIMEQYPPRYRRLTAEDVRRYGIGMPRNYGLETLRAAKGGSIGSTFDDELGYDYVRGGLTALASGGNMPPRYLNGGGDGMSDSIPARIDGKQEARLSDSEFVIPADVVSHLGNGSSNAGAKKLYAMMDRIRKARTGKTKQSPAVKAERYMPA